MPNARAVEQIPFGDDHVSHLPLLNRPDSVSGSSEQARRGDVVLLVGGDERALAACGDVFGALARAAFHVE